MEEEEEQQQQQQQQQQQYEYQYQNKTNTQSYETPSQIQSYVPQSYYSSYYQNNTHYSSTSTYASSSSSTSSYYYPTPYQQTHDPNLVHPPGVPLSDDIPVNSLNLYYHSPQSISYLQPGQTVYGGGSQGGRSTRGGGRGTFGRHGRGRGRGGTRPRTSASASAATNTVEPAPSKPPPQMVWCELCRVDCNTLEILEQHKNGKKHQRNLKVFEEMQNVNQEISMAQPQPEAPQESDMADKAAPSLAQPSEDPTITRDSSVTRGGLKRKMKPGRGAKWLRGNDGSRRLVETPKPPKQIVHLLCELCNVKCESQVVYDSHLAGKKHLSNLKRYQGHKEAFGEGLQALYPKIPNLPSSSITPQVNQQLPQDAHAQDAHALASVLLSQQNLPDPQAAQAALVQLLNQHGIQDAQTLIVQLIPYLLTQAQASGSVPLPVAGLGLNDPYLQSQGLISNEAPSRNAGQDVGQNEGQIAEIKTEQETLASNDGSEAGVGVSAKPGDEPSKAAKVEAE